MQLLWYCLLGACLAACPARAQAYGYEDRVRDLPTTSRVWSFLENQAPWTVAEPMDTAGMQMGNRPLFGALGASWTENRYLLNGFDIADPYLPGRPLLDLPLQALSALDINSSERPSILGGSGTAVQMKPVDAPANFKGNVQVLLSGASLQSHFPRSEHLKHVVDVTANAGGLINGNVPVAVTFFTQDLSKTLDAFPAVMDGSSQGVLATAVPYRSGSTQLDLLFAAQRLFQSHAGATPYTSPAATLRNSMNTYVLQIGWKSSALAGGVGFVRSSDASEFQESAGDSVLELPQRILAASAPLAVSGTRTRIELNLNAYKDFTQHKFLAVVQYEWNSIDNRWEGRTQQILVNGTPTQTLYWNEPSADWSARIHNLAVSVQDTWRPHRRVVIPAGLRLGIASGGGVTWTRLEPRLEVQVAVGDRGPRLVGGWSRYGHLLQGRYLDFGNGSAPGGGIYGGQTLISRFGGADSAVDQGLKQPYTDEIVAGLDQALPGGWSAGVRLFRRDDRQMIGIENTGVPFSSYIPTMVTDPGNDGIDGTADDAQLLVYNRDPSTFGQDFLMLTNAPGLSNTCKGVRIYIEKSFSSGWDLSVTFAASKSDGTTSPGNSPWQNDVGVLNNLGTDPNTLILAKSTTFFDRGFVGKLTTVRHWSHGLRTGVVARYYDGLPFGRLLFVQDFHQGPFFVRATPRDNFPDGFRTEFNATLDVRVAKDFKSWTAIADVFNLLNLNRNTREDDLTGPLFASRVPVTTQAPLVVRLGFQWRF